LSGDQVEHGTLPFLAICEHSSVTQEPYGHTDVAKAIRVMLNEGLHIAHQVLAELVDEHCDGADAEF
jgi:hypothetical protein